MENVCEAKAATKSAAAVPWICCTAFVFFKEIMLNKLKTALANERIKDGVDYAIIFKYGMYHLMCADVWLDSISMTAKEFGITFSSTSTFPIQNLKYQVYLHQKIKDRNPLNNYPHPLDK